MQFLFQIKYRIFHCHFCQLGIKNLIWIWLTFDKLVSNTSKLIILATIFWLVDKPDLNMQQLLTMMNNTLDNEITNKSYRIVQKHLPLHRVIVRNS